jgi:hypothetical protein
MFQLTNKGVDRLDSRNTTPSSQLMDILGLKNISSKVTIPILEVMKSGLGDWRLLVSVALSSLSGLFAIFYKRRRPTFAKDCPELF